MNRFAAAKPPARRPSTSPGRAARSSGESEAVVRFRKVLELELRRGCDDGAVIGGVDKFLANARQDRAVASLIGAAPALESGYAGLTHSAREGWLRSVLAAKPSRAKAADGAERRSTGSGPSRASGRAGMGASRPDEGPSTSSGRAGTGAPADPLDAPVTVVKGVKGVLGARLAKLGIETVRDLLYLFPNRHNDFANVRPIAELVPDEEQTALVSVWSAAKVRLGRREGTQVVVGDDTGTMRVVWFNQPYLADQLKTNDRIVLAGKVTLFNRLKTMESPEWERLQTDDLTHTGRLVPVYPLTQGLSQRVLRRAVKEAVDRFVGLVREPLPEDLRRRHKLPGLQDALRQMHYPESMERHEEARRRVAFEELLGVQLAVLEKRLQWQDGRAPALALDGVLEVYRSGLPFALTGAQERVLSEIVGDITAHRPMARLLQGDVGSGKTAVAGAALVIAAANGFQAALMAPTEILAEQHYRTLTNLIGQLVLRGPQVLREPQDERRGGRKMRIELLTGSTAAKSKREVVEAIAAGEVDVVVGTHALIQEGVQFRRLGIAVVDEQHRFGVMQRAALREQAAEDGATSPPRSPSPTSERGRAHVESAEANSVQVPHLLVMSATPIPRTLALTFFGDLDVSVIDEMPPGRLPVETHWVPPDGRLEAYGFVRQQVRAGRQAFVVCPLIEESPSLQSRAATQEYERLSRDVFPELRVGLLHGRMASKDKDAVLESFRRGELHVLVATTVIEVGIDIPNATVMVIEGADRFGLAQMHQLRGRVGRGAEQSFCLLLSDDPSLTAQERLRLLEELNDGFALAEADLRLRGPGDVLGTRQSGIPELQAADFSDVRLIETARQEAMQLLASDPGLTKPEHALLRQSVERMKRIVTGDAS